MMGEVDGLSTYYLEISRHAYFPCRSSDFRRTKLLYCITLFSKILCQSHQTPFRSSRRH